MKPKDENGKLPTRERPFRVLSISGSSPARQEELGLNEDLTLRPKQSEEEKLREE